MGVKLLSILIDVRWGCQELVIYVFEFASRNLIQLHLWYCDIKEHAVHNTKSYY